MKKKVIALVLVCVLVFGIAVGSTLAWLVDKTATVKNTFTVGDVEISLWENETEISTTTENKNFKILPGLDQEKDVEVKVAAGSEACYLFVELTESSRDVTGSDVNYFDYTVITGVNGWTPLDGFANVYYREVNDTNAEQTFDVFAETEGKEIIVDDNLTKAQLNALGENQPSLSVTAYAVQREGVASAAAAWGIAKN